MKLGGECWLERTFRPRFHRGPPPAVVKSTHEFMKASPFLLSLVVLSGCLVPAAGARESAPSKSLAAEDWSAIRAAHEAWQHRFEAGADGTHVARNPGQQWTTRFDGRGFLVEPAGQAWRWGLELRSYGVGDRRQRIEGPARVAKSADRLRYRWDGTMEEWFRNDRRGLEQGWTVDERPAGGAQQKLRLDLAVRGGLSPAVAADGLSVAFLDRTGETVLAYGGLKAWDARGRDLAVRFLPGSGKAGLAVEVDERGAVYPVTIDPIAQQTRLKADNEGTSDSFGESSAISGDTAVVGAPLEDAPAMRSATRGRPTCLCARVPLGSSRPTSGQATPT